MSLDKSLKSKGTLVRHRNVLTRAERVNILKEEGRWQEGDAVFGLNKVAHRKAKVGGKAKQAGAPTAAAESAPQEQAK
jgi:small basic protein (TIGR04137 family)